MQMVLATPARSPILIALASAGALAAAFLAQYGFDLQPCILCIYQRWPYAVALGVSLLALLLAGRRAPLTALLGLCALAFMVNAGIAGSHVGIEQHWWAGTEACTGPSGEAASVQELLAQIQAAPVVRCDEVAWSLFGISMAGYNLLASLALAGFSLSMARRAGRRA